MEQRSRYHNNNNLLNTSQCEKRMNQFPCVIPLLVDERCRKAQSCRSRAAVIMVDLMRAGPRTARFQEQLIKLIKILN